MNFPDVLRTICSTRLPITQWAFGIDLTLPLPWPYTSLGNLHLLIEPRKHPTPVPRFDLWVGQIVKSSISFGVSKMPARDKIRSTSVSGSPQVTWNVFFTTMQGNNKKYATSVFSIIIPKVPPANDLNQQEISLLACKMRRLYNRSVS